MIFRYSFSRLFAGAMALIFFVTNTLLAHVPESGFWTERRHHTRSVEKKSDNVLLASLPTGDSARILSDLPSIRSASLQQLTPALAEQIRTQDPQGAVPHISSLIQTLPQTFGQVRRLAFPEISRPSKTIVHIQDVHLNQEAQRNIGAAVQALVNQDKIQLVALEGSFEPIHLDKLRSFPHKETVRVVADDMLVKNEISGPVHAALTSDRPIPPLEGIDHSTQHYRNVEAYKQSVPLTPVYKARLTELQKEVAARKAKTFNVDLASFDAQVEAHRCNAVPLGDYLRLLVSKTQDADTNVQNFLAALDAENHLDFSQVEKERRVIIEALAAKTKKEDMQSLLDESVAYRVGRIGHGIFYRHLQEICRRIGLDLARTPAMKAYIEYVLLSDRINTEKLFQEIVQLEHRAYDRLARTPEEKQLVVDSRRLYFIGKLLDFSLTPDEWKEYQTLAISISLMDLSTYETFYHEAENRNISMTENLLAAMDRAKASTAVLVAGGFHSEGIEESLRRRGVVCLTFTPKVTKTDEVSGGAYLSVFTQQKTPLEKIFEGEKLFVAKDGCPESTSLRFILRAAAYDLLHRSLDLKVVPIVLREYAGKTADKIGSVHSHVSLNRAEIVGTTYKEVCERTTDGALHFSEQPLTLADKVNPLKILKESRFLLLPLLTQVAASVGLLMVRHGVEFLPAVLSGSILFNTAVLFLSRRTFLHIHSRADFHRVASDFYVRYGRRLSYREYTAYVLRGYGFFGVASAGFYGGLFPIILSLFSTASPDAILLSAVVSAVGALIMGGFIIHPGYNMLSPVPAMARIMDKERDRLIEEIRRAYIEVKPGERRSLGDASRVVSLTNGSLTRRFPTPTGTIKHRFGIGVVKDIQSVKIDVGCDEKGVLFLEFGYKIRGGGTGSFIHRWDETVGDFTKPKDVLVERLERYYDDLKPGDRQRFGDPGRLVDRKYGRLSMIFPLPRKPAGDSNIAFARKSDLISVTMDVGREPDGSYYWVFEYVWNDDGPETSILRLDPATNLMTKPKDPAVDALDRAYESLKPGEQRKVEGIERMIRLERGTLHKSFPAPDGLLGDAQPIGGGPGLRSVALNVGRDDDGELFWDFEYVSRDGSSRKSLLRWERANRRFVDDVPKNLVFKISEGRLLLQKSGSRFFGPKEVETYSNAIVKNVSVGPDGFVHLGGEHIGGLKDFVGRRDMTVEYRDGNIARIWAGDPFPGNDTDHPRNEQDVPVVWSVGFRNVFYEILDGRLVLKKRQVSKVMPQTKSRFPDTIIKNAWINGQGALKIGGDAIFVGKLKYANRKDISIQYIDGKAVRVWAGDPYPENDLTKPDPLVPLIWQAEKPPLLNLTHDQIKVVLLTGKDPSGDSIDPEWEKDRVKASLRWLVDGLWASRTQAMKVLSSEGVGIKVNTLNDSLNPNSTMLPTYWLATRIAEEAQRALGMRIEPSWIDPAGTIHKRNCIYEINGRSLLEKKYGLPEYPEELVMKYPNAIVKNVWANRNGGVTHGNQVVISVYTECAGRHDLTLEYRDGKVVRVWLGDPYPENDMSQPRPESEVPIIWTLGERNVLYAIKGRRLVKKNDGLSKYTVDSVKQHPDAVLKNVWLDNKGTLHIANELVFQVLRQYANRKDITLEYRDGTVLRAWAGDPFPQGDIDNPRPESEVPLIWIRSEDAAKRNTVYEASEDGRLLKRQQGGRDFGPEMAVKYPNAVVKNAWTDKTGILSHGGGTVFKSRENSDRKDITLQYQDGKPVRAWVGDPFPSDDMRSPDPGVRVIWERREASKNVIYLADGQRLVRQEGDFESYSPKLVEKFPAAIVKNVWTTANGALTHGGERVFKSRKGCEDRSDMTLEYMGGKVIRVWMGDPYPEDDLAKPDHQVPLLWQADGMTTPGWPVQNTLHRGREPKEGSRTSYDKAVDLFEKYHVLELAISLSSQPEELQQALAILLTAQGAEVKDAELQELSRSFVLNLREGQGGKGRDFVAPDPLEYLRALMALQEEISKLSEHEQFVLMRAFVRLAFSRFAANFEESMKQMREALASAPSTPFLQALVEHVEQTLGQGLVFQPSHIKTLLLPHQRMGAWYMRHSEVHQKDGVFGFLLEDDTRLGKTIQTYAALDPSWKCALAVPANMMDTWEEQYYQHTDGRMKFIPVLGTPEQKRRIIEETKGQKGIILLFSIEDLRGRSREEFEAVSQDLDLEVVDEAQQIENYGGQALKTSSLQAKAIHQLKAPRRWLLSATPYTSDYRQLFSIFNLIHTNPVTGQVTNPMFETRTAFNRVFNGSLESKKLMYALKARIALRRKKSEQGKLYSQAKEINPEEEGAYTVTREQAELTLRIIKNIGEYLKLYNQRVPSEERISMRSISVFLKLQFLSWAMTDPSILGEKIATTYWDVMDRRVEPRLKAGRPGILFFENTALIDKAVERYRTKGYRVVRIDGAVTGNAMDDHGRLIKVRFEGKRMVEDPVGGHPVSAQAYGRHLFQAGRADVVVMNRRGGRGLDLSRAEWELFCQLPDTYVNYYQPRDRGLGLNPDPTGQKIKEVEVLFMLPRYPKDFLEKILATPDAGSVRHGTPAEILFRLMMGEQKDQFNLIMEGIPPGKEITEQEALSRLVHSVQGFLQDPSMSNLGKRQKREMKASSVFYPIYQKVKGDKILEDEVLTLVGNFGRTEASPTALARKLALSPEFNLKDLPFINALFDIPNKQQRDQLLGLLPDLYGILLKHHLGISELTERGPPALQAMAQAQLELVIPFIAASHGWNVRETEEQVLEPSHPGALPLLQMLEEVYADGFSDYDQQQWAKRYVSGLLGLSDLGHNEFLNFLSRQQEDLLDENLSLENRVSFLERLGVLRQSSPDTYRKLLQSTDTFTHVQEILNEALTDTFIDIFELPRSSETFDRLAALGRQWGSLNAPLRLMSKLMGGDAKDYADHIALFKKEIQHIVAGEYAQWRNEQSVDRIGHEIAYKQDDPAFWRVFTREEEVSLGKVTVTPRELIKARERRMRDVARLLEDRDGLEEAFGPLVRVIEKDLKTPDSLEKIRQELGVVGRQRGALQEDQTAAIEELNRQLRSLRARINLLSLRQVLQEGHPDEAARPLKALIGELTAQPPKEGQPLLLLALKDLESTLDQGAVTRTFEDVEIRITSDPDLMMRRGMLEEDMKNCFNLTNGRPQVATLVDDLASRNKMLAVVKVGGRTASAAILKVRRTPDGKPVIMVERPLYRFGYNFEREIAEAVNRTKFPEMPGVPVAGDWYQGEEKSRMIQLESTGARGPTEYHESLFNYRRRDAKVHHVAGVLIEAGAPEGAVDDVKEGITRIRIPVEGRAHDVMGLGHSTRTQPDFLALVSRLGIKRLVDLRSSPKSQYYPQFNRKAMESFLAAAGIEYVWMGEKLGGKLPEYNGNFEAYMKEDPSGRFSEGMEELRRSIGEANGPVAVMCSERNPQECHRRFVLSELAGEQGGQLDLFDKPKGRMSLVSGSEFYEKFISPIWESPILGIITAGMPSLGIWKVLEMVTTGDSFVALAAGAVLLVAMLSTWGYFISVWAFTEAHRGRRRLGNAPALTHWISTALTTVALGLAMAAHGFAAITLSLPVLLVIGAATYTIVHTAIHLYHNITRPRTERMSLQPKENVIATDYSSALDSLVNHGKIPASLLERILPEDMKPLGLADMDSRGISTMSKQLPQLLEQPKFRASFYGTLKSNPLSVAKTLVKGGIDLRKTKVPVRLVGEDPEDIEDALRTAELINQIGEQNLKLVLSAKTPAVLERLKSMESEFVYVSPDRLAKTNWRAEDTNVYLMKTDHIDSDAALAMIRALPLGTDLLRILERLLSSPIERQDIEIRLKAAVAIMKYA
jgi:hypothetical protein